MNGMSDSSKIYVIEERVNGHETRIVKLEDSITMLGKLETILEQQVSINQKQTEQADLANRNSEKTFQAINQNLTQLNMITERLKEDLDKSHQKSEAEIDELREQVSSSLEKRKIDTSDWGVRLFYWGIMAISTLLLGWAMATAGWN